MVENCHNFLGNNILISKNGLRAGTGHGDVRLMACVASIARASMTSNSDPCTGKQSGPEP